MGCVDATSHEMGDGSTMLNSAMGTDPCWPCEPDGSHDQDHDHGGSGGSSSNMGGSDGDGDHDHDHDHDHDASASSNDASSAQPLIAISGILLALGGVYRAAA